MLYIPHNNMSKQCMLDIPYVIFLNQNRITYDLKIPTWLKAKQLKPNQVNLTLTFNDHAGEKMHQYG